MKPESGSDGWTIANPRPEGLAPDYLEKMENAIGSGEFRKITSVLVARRGSLRRKDGFDPLLTGTS